MVELFVLDCTALGGSIFRFHAGTNGIGAAVIWQGVTYSPFPIQAEGFDMSSKGVMPRPTLRVSNVDGVVGAQVRAYGDLVGATVTRKRTLAKFLDAVNFSGGNPNADPTAAFADDVFYVEQRTTETAEMIEFQLSAASDLQGLMLPSRIVQASVCMEHDATVCAYSVGNQCTKTLDACKAHWGVAADLPFGGFPGAGRAT
jgi:lambda family phage minor tail protein L